MISWWSIVCTTFLGLIDYFWCCVWALSRLAYLCVTWSLCDLYALCGKSCSVTIVISATSEVSGHSVICCLHIMTSNCLVSIFDVNNVL